MLLVHLHFLFGKCLLGSAHFLILLFVFLMLSCVNYLYMLDINFISVISFPNIFSHSVVCLFILSMICCVKAFKFNCVQLLSRVQLFATP